MDVIAAFVADSQPPVLVQPGDRALDDPALRPEPRAVVALRPSDLRPDVPATQLGAPFARVVCAVAVQRPRTGGISSMSGISWVMSLRLPPVSEQASGVPRPQATT